MFNGDKTEAATPRRREDARKEGQAARSPEVGAVAGLIAGLLAIRFTMGHIVAGLHSCVDMTLGNCGKVELNPHMVQSQTLSIGMTIGSIVGPIALAVCVAGLAGSLLQVGFMYSTKPLVPDFKRLNVLQGLTRLVSVQSGVQLAKSVAKALIVCAIIYTYLKANTERVVGLATLDLWSIARVVGGMIWEVLIRSAMALIIIAFLDYIFQRLQFEKNLRMTKQEVKEEYKRTEGDPHVRARRRQRQRELARQRMMQEVRRATVVVTNPTHIAVALRYDAATMAAPVVVAKGERLLAERIKSIAKESRVPVIENVPLARALNKNVRVGEPVPADLYQAVAEVLAFVFRMSGKTVAGARA
jgi:flagellar biosynthesis protein FlhB